MPTLAAKNSVIVALVAVTAACHGSQPMQPTIQLETAGQDQSATARLVEPNLFVMPRVATNAHERRDLGPKPAVTKPLLDPSTTQSVPHHFPPTRESIRRKTFKARKFDTLPFDAPSQRQVETAIARRCYQNQLRSRPGLSGTVKVVIVVGVNGRARSVTIESTLNDPRIEQCITAGFRRINYRAPSDTIFERTLSFVADD